MRKDIGHFTGLPASHLPYLPSTEGLTYKMSRRCDVDLCPPTQITMIVDVWQMCAHVQ